MKKTKGTEVMTNNTRRAIIIKDFPSSYVSEAIIFLNDEVKAKDTKIIEEAQKIISEYMNGCRFLNDVHFVADNDISIYTSKKQLAKKKKTRHSRFVVITSIITTLVALCVFGVFNYINS